MPECDRAFVDVHIDVGTRLAVLVAELIACVERHHESIKCFDRTDRCGLCVPAASRWLAEDAIERFVPFVGKTRIIGH